MTFLQKIQQVFRKNQKSKDSIADLTRSQIIPPDRPPEVLNVIGKKYTKMLLEPHVKFGFAKNQDYTFSFIDISGSDFILRYLNTIHKEQLTILIIGAGDATFALNLEKILGKRVRIYFLTPTEHIVNEDDENSEIIFTKGNAEYLFTLFPASMFDIILSAQVFANFVDPLGLLQQMYQALIPGGVMLIDDFQLNGLQDQLPSLFAYLNDHQFIIVPDYTYALENKDIIIKSVRSFIVKKTLPQLEFPGITYGKLEECEKKLKENDILYTVAQPFPSFRKHISLETEAFLNIVHSIIPNLSEEEIIQSILNPHILNSQLTSIEQDAYAYALQNSFSHLLKTQNISFSEQLVQEAIPMTVFIGKWMEQIRNKQQFIMSIRERIGVNIPEK